MVLAEHWGRMRSFGLDPAMNNPAPVLGTAELTAVTTVPTALRSPGPSGDVAVSWGGPQGWRAVAKRAVDIVAGVVLLVAILPVMAVLAVGVRVSSPGPVLYRQDRVGRHGRTFRIMKFRSFPVDHRPPRSAHGDIIPVAPSPIRFGAFIRRTSLDELPQLLNVIAGHMSLVGPRPERPELAAEFARSIPGYALRHRAPVGITGVAQVRGLTGATSIEQRIVVDNEYIDDWSLRRDFGLLLRTVPALVRKSKG